MSKGLFITLEGIDGSGKTSQARRLVAALAQKNIPITVTREPGGSPTGEEIRKILVDSAHLALDSKAELLLFLANRFQNIEEVIQPTLAKGGIILSDRHRDSSVAFQGAGRELGVDWVDELHNYLGIGQPDLTLLFDISVEVSQQRRAERTGSDRFEGSDTAFHERVRDAYLLLAKKYPERFVIIDGEPSKEDVAQTVRRTLAKRYPEHFGSLIY